MDIRLLDPADDDALHEAYGLQRRSQLEGRDGMPFWSWQEMSGAYRSQDPGERLIMWGGYEAGRLVGLAHVYLPLLDNLDKAWGAVEVDPPQRRRGYGARLLETLAGELRAQGRSQAVFELAVPFEQREDHGYRRFAERHGCTWANVEIVRHLPLPVPAADVERWAQLAAERHDGYVLETHVDGVPDDLVPTLCVLMSQLAVDAPTGAVDWEEETISPDRYRHSIVELVDAGRTIYETVALTPQREVVAQSTLSVPRTGRTDCSQWGTFVHRQHRGHRLGLAVKAANLRRLQANHPDMQRVVTQNAETNDHMVAINELMGFAPVETSTEMLLQL